MSGKPQATPPWPMPSWDNWDSTFSAPRTKPPVIRPCCVDCLRELCSELDAYYGTDPWYAARCRKCRQGRR